MKSHFTVLVLEVNETFHFFQRNFRYENVQLFPKKRNEIESRPMESHLITKLMFNQFLGLRARTDTA